MGKSNLSYMHRQKSVNVSCGKKCVEEQAIYQGDRGLTMKHFSSNSNGSEKMVAVKKGDKFLVKIIKNGQKEIYDYTNTQLVELLRANVKFNPMVEFLKMSEERGHENTLVDADKQNKHPHEHPHEHLHEHTHKHLHKHDKKDKKDKKDKSHEHKHLHKKSHKKSHKKHHEPKVEPKVELEVELEVEPEVEPEIEP